MITPDREAYPDVLGSALYPAVLGVGGSPRQGGNSDLLLSRILKGATTGNLAVETLQLRDLNFQSCSGCEQCRKARRCTGLLDDMSAVYPRLLEARGVVLVSPTHHYNITALMKAFIDRLYCFYEFTRARPRG